jgi:hypothetical protein
MDAVPKRLDDEGPRAEGSGAVLDHPILRRPDSPSGKGLLALREAAGIAVQRHRHLSVARGMAQID